jgi:hypothetical protein
MAYYGAFKYPAVLGRRGAGGKVASMGKYDDSYQKNTGVKKTRPPEGPAALFW